MVFGCSTGANHPSNAQVSHQHYVAFPDACHGCSDYGLESTTSQFRHRIYASAYVTSCSSVSTITQHGFAIRCSQGLLDNIAYLICQPKFRRLVCRHVEVYPAEHRGLVGQGVVGRMELAYHKANQEEGRLRILYLNTRLRQQFLSPCLLAWLVGLRVYWIDDMDLRWSIIYRNPQYVTTPTISETNRFLTLGKVARLAGPVASSVRLNGQD